MPTFTDIVNRALQKIGKRTTVTDAEIANETSNEAIQANLIRESSRRDLLRMAPWNCALYFNSLVYITSSPGTPENNTTLTTWARGVPAPPWQYEYQYPVDCLKALWIVPQVFTADFGGVPIYPVPTGWSPSIMTGSFIKFQVSIDTFVPVVSAVVSAGGTGYAVGEELTLAETPDGDPPIGAPVKLLVATLTVTAVATVTVVNQVYDASPTQGGSYFAQQTNPVAQSATDGSGSGATFTLTYGTKASQRVILTNQPEAIMAYIKDVTEINVLDDLFLEAWVQVIAGLLAYALTGDKDLANARFKYANEAITQARVASGNEGPTIDNRTPDWIRVRGYEGAETYAPSGYDWGGLWPLY